jgi:hypothetical protein
MGMVNGLRAEYLRLKEGKVTISPPFRAFLEDVYSVCCRRTEIEQMWEK